MLRRRVCRAELTTTETEGNLGHSGEKSWRKQLCSCGHTRIDNSWISTNSRSGYGMIRNGIGLEL